jgi:hypothetical protein
VGSILKVAAILVCVHSTALEGLLQPLKKFVVAPRMKKIPQPWLRVRVILQRDSNKNTKILIVILYIYITIHLYI